jgi:phosphate transport system substrate-binding protein
MRAALSLAAALCCVSVVAAQDKPASLILHIAVSTSGRTVFDSLIETMTARAGLTSRFTVDHTTALDGLRDFCQNISGKSPDIVMATHRMQAGLAAECAKNGVDNIAVVELARSALILAVHAGSMLSQLTSRQVYLAIAREVPSRGDFARNTAVRWSDIDRSLPPQDIRFQLPMRDDGSRAIFDSLVLEGGCRHEPEVKAIFDAQQRTTRCVAARYDRVREIPRPQAARMLLEAPLGTVGVVSQHDIAESDGQLVGLTLDGETPDHDAVRRGTYEYSSSFWLYAKRDQAQEGGSDSVDAAVERMVSEAQSEAVIGPDGPLPGLGASPLPANERAAQRDALMDSNASFGLASIMHWVVDTGSDAWIMFGVRPAVPPEEAAFATDFTNLMDIAGYRVTELGSSIGILPDAGMVFSIVREMSDSDQVYLGRMLYHDAIRRPGLLPALQRRIVRSVMAVREVGGFEVSRVEIVFLPLPKVGLTVSPSDVLRANQRQSGQTGGDAE